MNQAILSLDMLPTSAPEASRLAQAIAEKASPGRTPLNGSRPVFAGGRARGASAQARNECLDLRKLGWIQRAVVG
jgi:hypothetical protein